MEGILRRLQTVVDVSEDDDTVVENAEAELCDMPTDVGELQRRLLQALRRVKMSSEKWDELRSESCGIEAELAALRQKFKTSRETWLLVHQFNQASIDALLEERFNAGNNGLVAAADCEVATSTDRKYHNTHDRTYVSSLQEQNQTLKELLQRYSDERDKYKLEAQNLRNSANPENKTTEDVVKDALVSNDEELAQSERRNMEMQIEQLEVALSRQSEAMLEMTLQDRANNDAWEDKKSTADSQLQHIQQLERELAAWRSSAGGTAATSIPPPPPPAAASPIGGDFTPEYFGEKSATTICESTSPLMAKKGDGLEVNDANFGGMLNITEDLAKKLEETEAENNAREEALNALYQDLHELRERNGDLERQLTDVEEQLQHTRQELVVTQDQCRTEQERNEQLHELLHQAEQQRQKLGKELAGANEERRRLRLIMGSTASPAEMVPPPTAVAMKTNVADHATLLGNSGAYSGKPHFIASAGRKLQDLRNAAWSSPHSGASMEHTTATFFNLVRAMGRRRIILGVLVAVVVIVTLVGQAGLGAADTEVIVTKIQSDLIACQAQLKAAGGGRKTN